MMTTFDHHYRLCHARRDSQSSCSVPSTRFAFVMLDRSDARAPVRASQAGHDASGNEPLSGTRQGLCLGHP